MDAIANGAPEPGLCGGIGSDPELDVSIQRQVLDLIASLQEKLGISILFITHDLRVAAQVCDRIAVMHRGRVVEEGSAEDILTRPTEAYTAALIAAAPGRARPRLDAPNCCA